MAIKDKGEEKPEYDAHGDKIIKKGEGHYFTDKALVITKLDWDNPWNQPNHAFPSEEDILQWKKKNKPKPNLRKNTRAPNPMAIKKEAFKMRKGPGWLLRSPDGSERYASLWQNLHIDNGKSLAVFYVTKRAKKPKP